MNSRARAAYAQEGSRVREWRNAYWRDYYRSNREQCLRDAFVKKQRRRAAIAKADCGCVSAQALKLLGDALNWSCIYCGGEFEHWDHATPISKGGLHCIENLATACADCNLRKNAKTQAEFLAWST